MSCVPLLTTTTLLSEAPWGWKLLQLFWIMPIIWRPRY